jgi:hypothetical protein
LTADPVAHFVLALLLVSLLPDAIQHVMSFLDGASIGKCETVCKALKEAGASKHPWKSALMADFALSRSQR